MLCQGRVTITTIIEKPHVREIDCSRLLAQAELWQRFAPVVLLVESEDYQYVDAGIMRVGRERN